MATLAISAVGFGLLSAQYGWSLWAGDEPWWQGVFASVTSPRFAGGPGSVAIDQAAAYEASRGAMSGHMLLGGLVLILAAIQLLPATRRRPALHRWLGRGYVAAAVAMIASSVVFLLRNDSSTIYAGPLFMLDLWGLAATYSATGLLAVVAIRQRRVDTHRAWMVMHFSLLQGAPALRLAWVLGYPLSDWSQAEITPVVAIVVFPLLIWAPCVWLMSRRSQAPTVDTSPLGALQTAAWAASAVAAGVGGLCLQAGSTVDVATWMAAAAMALSGAVSFHALGARHQSRGDRFRAAECAIHANACVASPVAALPVGVGLWAVGLSMSVSAAGGLGVGLVCCTLGGYALAMARRGLVGVRAPIAPALS